MSDVVLNALRRLSLSADAQIQLRWHDGALVVSAVDYGDGTKRVAGKTLSVFDLASCESPDALLAEALVNVQRRIAGEHVMTDKARAKREKTREILMRRDRGEA